MTVTASNFARKENELYETEPWATEALLRHIDVDGKRVWEPSHGNGKITWVLAEAGAYVTPSDIVHYDDPRMQLFDFLREDSGELYFDWIVTNPPYGKGNRDAVRYAELALERADNVALLLTAKFDFGKTRRHLFADNPRFMAKIALLDRISWAGNGETGTEDHAWYVWRGEPGPAPVMMWEGKA